MPQPQDNVQHIIVLMLENRSFDNMLGWQFGLDSQKFNGTDQLFAAAALPPRDLLLPHRITTPGEARPYIRTKVNAFLRRLEAE